MNKTSKKILLVDDDHFFREILKDTLKERYQVSELGSGTDLVERVVAEPPDLIVLDVEMPGSSGIQACRELKENQATRQVPVLLFSAHNRKEEIILGLQAGADDYLTKPMCPSEVLARIDAHLRSKGGYAELEHRDLLMLLELSESLTVSRNPMKILRLIVDKVAEVVDVARCSIVSFNQAGELIVKASSDLKGDMEIRLEIERYPEIDQAFRTKRAVVIDDITNDPLMEPVRQHLKGLGFTSIVVVPIIKKESVIGTLFLRTASSLQGAESERIFNLCLLVANISATALENAILFESIRTAQEYFEEMSIRDGLTKLFTHRYFYDRLDEEFSRATRHKEPLSLIFFDIDDFKRINDRYGHTRGDVVLRQIGRSIKQLARESDIPARYGGEEFAILLPNTQLEGAREMARRLGAMIRQQNYEALPGESVTVSIGIASYFNGYPEHYSKLVELADSAMYQAKSKGKNQLAVADQGSGD